MSFWKQNPGPTWWDCIESFNPCGQITNGICNSEIVKRARIIHLNQKFVITEMKAKHAFEIETFLRNHFTLYSRCRISLSKDRIQQGFQQDSWIGVGIFTRDNFLIGCCISKPLGRMKFSHGILEETGVVDYFCVHKEYRGGGLAQKMLDELVFLTAKKKRLVHIFLKEGLPLLSMPPLYSSRYLVRKRKQPGENQAFLRRMDDQKFSHSEYFPLAKYIANLPTGPMRDSKLYIFTYKSHTVYLCMTDLHHRTVPEGNRIGELLWVLPQTVEVPLSIQRLAVETCVDSSEYDLILLDSKIPHIDTSWNKDASFSWYIFNYNPGGFFNMKPFFIF